MVAKLVDKGDVIGLKALLEKSRDDNDWDPYLVTAAQKNLQLEAFGLLISAGEDVRATGRWWKTPLHEAQDEQIA
jgi:hypothetical protein